MARADFFELWRERLEDYSVSEMTVSDWCQFNALPLHQFYYWKRKLQKADSPPTQAPAGWTAVHVRPDRPEEKPTITLRIRSAEIQLRSGFDPGLLREIVLVLQSASC